MAEEFKFNEKTGMYEIVKNNKDEKNKDHKEETQTGTTNKYSRDYNTMDRFGKEPEREVEQNKTESQKNTSPTETVNSSDEGKKHTSNAQMDENEQSNYDTHYHTSSNSHPYNTQNQNRNSQNRQSNSGSKNNQGPYSGQNRSKNGLEDFLENEQTMGTLVWVGTIVAAFVLNIFFIIVPLVFYVLYENKSSFVRSHSKEALNVSISLIVYGVGLALVGFLLSGILMVVNPFFMAGSVTIVLASILVSIYGLVVGIQGAIAANKKELYKAPLTIRFIK